MTEREPTRQRRHKNAQADCTAAAQECKKAVPRCCLLQRFWFFQKQQVANALVAPERDELSPEEQRELPHIDRHHRPTAAPARALRGATARATRGARVALLLQGDARSRRSRRRHGYGSQRRGVAAAGQEVIATAGGDGRASPAGAAGGGGERDDSEGRRGAAARGRIHALSLRKGVAERSTLRTG